MSDNVGQAPSVRSSNRNSTLVSQRSSVRSSVVPSSRNSITPSETSERNMNTPQSHARVRRSNFLIINKYANFIKMISSLLSLQVG